MEQSGWSLLKFILNSDSYVISIIIRFRIFCSVSVYFFDQEKALKSLLLLQPSLRVTLMGFLGLLPPVCSGAKGTASMSPPHLWPHQCPGCDPSLLGQPWLWHLEGTPGARQGPFLSLTISLLAKHRTNQSRFWRRDPSAPGPKVEGRWRPVDSVRISTVARHGAPCSVPWVERQLQPAVGGFWCPRLPGGSQAPVPIRPQSWEVQPPSKKNGWCRSTSFESSTRLQAMSIFLSE